MKHTFGFETQYTRGKMGQIASSTALRWHDKLDANDMHLTGGQKVAGWKTVCSGDF